MCLNTEIAKTKMREEINNAESIEHLHEMLSSQCILSCAHSGDNYPACHYWVKYLGLDIPRETCIAWLAEYGAWETNSLRYESSLELNIKVLWLAAGYKGGEE